MLRVRQKFPVEINGKSHETIVLADRLAEAKVKRIMAMAAAAVVKFAGGTAR